MALKEIRRQPGDVSTQDHELAMRHVDDAHLAEDDRKTERHQHVDGKQDQAREALHDEDRAQITNRIIAEHRSALQSPGRLASRRSRREKWLSSELRAMKRACL